MSLEDLTVDQLRERASQWQASDTLLRSLGQNPETREVIQRAIKKVSPKTVIPEIDATDRVVKLVEEEREARLKLERSIQEDQIRRGLEQKKQAVIDKYRLTKEDIEGVEKLMVDQENPIPTYEAAAQVYRAQRLSATPSPAHYAPPVYTMPEEKTWARGIGNKAMLNKIALNEAYSAWSDISSGKVAGLGGTRP